MEEEFLVVYEAILTKKKEVVERRRLLKHLRDSSDPFSMPDSAFVQYFRINKILCWSLIQELQPHDVQVSSMPFTLRFLAALSFYAHGSYQKCVGHNFAISMSQPSVSRSLHYISQLLIKIKSNQIRFPMTTEELLDTKTGFHNHFGIKDTIGAIDCTHIGIISPPANDARNPLSLYMNRKGCYSINVEAVCDHRLLFTAVNAKFPGSCHDSGIWTTSEVRLEMMRNHSSQRNSWLIGDQGYPLQPWLLTPVANPYNGKEEKFNKLHAKARNTIERAFGVLKSRFRCLSKHRILNYSHNNAANIVYACAILHNIILKNSGATDIDEEEVEVVPEASNEINVNGNDQLREGERLRTRYILTL